MARTNPPVDRARRIAKLVFAHTEEFNPRAANTVLLGAVSKRLDIDEKYWLEALQKMVPAKALEINRKAFVMGRELA